MERSKKSLRALFLRNLFFAVTISTLSMVFLSAVVLHQTSNRIINKFYIRNLALFSENVAADILSGRHYEVSRKCREFALDEEIERISIVSSTDDVICEVNRASGLDSVEYTKNVHFDSISSDVAARIRVRYTAAFGRSFVLVNLSLIALIIISIALVTFLVARNRFRIISDDFSSASLQIEAASEYDLSNLVELARKTEVLELDRLLSRLVDTGARFKQLKESQIDAVFANSQMEIASQVAHDIRSPLAALEMIVDRLGQLPEDERVIVRSAVNRIKDIANDLLAGVRSSSSRRRPAIAGPKIGDVMSAGQRAGRRTEILLSTLIESLVSEKRSQYRSKIGITVDSCIDEVGYGMFASIDPVEFKRMLSNLITNAVEAVDIAAGEVVVHLLKGVDGQARIEVRDNGVGIPQEHLSSLGQKGVSFGKTDGNGLGLYHARRVIEEMGGAFEIQSEPKVGTSVAIRVPLVQPPDWFASKLNIVRSGHVVVLDDDVSIHSVWRDRFESWNLSGVGVVVHHFSTPGELSQWVSAHQNDIGGTLFLIDYELLGHAQTGISLIESLKINPQSILVTSRYEDPMILDQTQCLGIKMIPKCLARLVPISIV